MKTQTDLTRFRDILIHPEHWRVVSNFFCDPGVSPVSAPPYAEKQKVQFHPETREIMISLQGNYVFRFNHKYYECLPGTIFLIDRNIEHEDGYAGNAEGILHLWTYTHQQNTVIHCVSMRRRKLKNLTIAFMHPSAGPDLDTLWDLWEQADSEPKRQWYLQQLKLYLAYSFSMFFLHPDQNSGNLSRFRLIEVAMERIRLELSRGISIGDLAQIIGYSRFHFAHLFKRLTGRTVLDYINQCRRERLELLSKQNLSPKEIASELGFQGVHSYYQWLRKNRQIISGPEDPS